MNRCDNCNRQCSGRFCCDGCEQEYGIVEGIDWEKLEAEVQAEIAAENAARRVC